MDEPRFSCPVCGTEHAHQSERYRNHVCSACEVRARCGHDRSVEGHNTSPMGAGFAARHADGDRGACEQVTDDGRVWIEGRELRMQEARFGGVVTVQLRRLVPVGDTVVWSEVDGVDRTSSGVPQPWLGLVAARTSRRRWWRRGGSACWQWVVRDARAHETYSAGVEDSREGARARVVEVLDGFRLADSSYV